MNTYRIFNIKSKKELIDEIAYLHRKLASQAIMLDKASELSKFVLDFSGDKSELKMAGEFESLKNQLLDDKLKLADNYLKID